MLLEVLYFITELNFPSFVKKDEFIIEADFSARLKFSRAHGGPTSAPDDPPDPDPPPPPGTPGAILPITYTLGDLPGTEWFIDDTGSDAAACTVGAPCLTISRAQSVASTGDSIAVRAGTYTTEGSTWNGSAWTAETTITKALTIAAYPGESPVFDGAALMPASGSWTTEGSYKYTTLIERPCTTGSGIEFCIGQNVKGGNGAVGEFPDQVWVNDAMIQQVTTKAAVAANKFYVDPGNNRLYMLTTDVNAATTIHASNLGDWLAVGVNGVTMKGLTVKRYSNTAARNGILDLNAGFDNFTLENMALHDAAMSTFYINSTFTNLSETINISHLTITGSNWMGIGSSYAKDITFDAILVTGLDRYDEYSDSPQSGAIKTGRNYNFTLKNSLIKDNRSHGVWLDQSNYRAFIANNVIKNNGGGTGACVFFEISDLLYLINNDIYCSPKNGVKLAGASGLYLVNNTIGGGSDPLGVYADNRSNLTSGCADWLVPLCSNSYSSDRWCPGYASTAYQNKCAGAVATPTRPATLDFMPRMDLMINNIIYDPTATGLCSLSTAFCLNSEHTQSPGAESTIQSVIHPAEPGRSIPATQIDCNVYANGLSRIISRQHSPSVTHYTAAQIGTWRTYTAGAPVSIAGIDANSLADPTGRTYVNADGTPTAALTALDTSACAVPTNADINLYIAAGTKRFGYLAN